MHYALINYAGRVENIILWDGAAPFDPGEGYTLVPAADLQPGDAAGDEPS